MPRDFGGIVCASITHRMGLSRTIPGFAVFAMIAPASAAEKTACESLDEAALLRGVEDVLRRESRDDLSPRLRLGVEGADGAVLELSVLDASDRPLVVRVFTLPPEECADAASLLEAVLRSAIDPIPRGPLVPSDSAEGPPVDSTFATVASEEPLEALPLPSPRSTHTAIVVSGNVHSDGRELELGARQTLFTRNVDAVLLLRASEPRRFGDGRMYASTLLAGVGASADLRAWRGALELRAGAIGVRGAGFNVNRSHVLPWAEAAVSLRRTFRYVRVGPQVAVSPYRHRTTLLDGSASRPIPHVRAGITFEITPTGRGR